MALNNLQNGGLKKIKVLIADDHTIVRQGLEHILATSANIEVVGNVDNGYDAISQVAKGIVDVILMDISMPGINGLEATRQICKAAPHIKILILTMHDNQEYLEETVEAGAFGYLLKDIAGKELINAIEAVYRGDCYFSPTISRKLINGYLRIKQRPYEENSIDSLTRREQEILKLLSEAKSNRKIAQTLCISVKTVETHRANIMKKLNVHTLTELVKYAIRRGFTKP